MFGGYCKGKARAICEGGERYIEERFLDCVSRRFAQNQRRGTLRSE